MGVWGRGLPGRGAAQACLVMLLGQKEAQRGCRAQRVRSRRRRLSCSHSSSKRLACNIHLILTQLHKALSLPALRAAETGVRRDDAALQGHTPNKDQSQDLNLDPLRMKPDSNWHMRQSLRTHSLELTELRLGQGDGSWTSTEHFPTGGGRELAFADSAQAELSPRPHTPSSIILPTILPPQVDVSTPLSRLLKLGSEG